MQSVLQSMPRGGTMLLALAPALLFALLLALPAAHAQTLTCYECESTFGIGDACYNVTNTTNTEQCTGTCLTTVTIGSTLVRSCNPAGLATGCHGVGSLKICYYVCSTNLCNTQGARGLAPTAGIVALAGLAAAALALSRGLAAA